MAARLEFSLLGTLLVSRDGAAVPIAAGRQRVLLAALLLSGGQLLRADELIEVVWGCQPPVSARASLRNHVKRLRDALGDSRARIRTDGRGYAIDVDADDLDVSRFEALLRAARMATRTGAWEQAASRAHAALALWRGEPLTGVDSEVLARREVPRLEELRLQALEVRLDADLRLGGQAGAIPELRRLVGVHPLREQLHALLMLALYQSGLQAAALAAYTDARQVLVSELGSQPGTRLRELHMRMLGGEELLAIPAPAPPADGGTAPVVPRGTPATVPHFVGREDELAALTALLVRPDQRAPGTAVISAIGGTAGVGKTALALHWAHQVAPRFPDGQLYVNLRGYDLGSPMPPEDALAGFLRALGVSAHDIPAGLDECAARYRGLLAGRRMLVLLDNARSVEQVRPLLARSAGCMTIVTSRDPMAGLVARQGARRIELGLLPLADSAALLRTLIGGRAAADPVATRTLAESCARLPLALRVAAQRAVTTPSTPLASLVAELTDERRCLDPLDAGGDPRTAVRAVLTWSYRRLPEAAARAFRLSALHPGPDLDAYSVAALIGGTLEQSAELLAQLVQASLLQPSPTSRNPADRYTRHDLLRAYGRELTTATDTDPERRAALTRLFDYYLHTAAAAANTLYPAACPSPDAPSPDESRPDESRPATPRPHASAPRLDASRTLTSRPDATHPGSPVPPVTSPAAAQAWLDAERASLVAVCAHAARRGWPSHASRLAAALDRYLDMGGYLSEAVIVHNAGRRAARRVGDRGAIAEALNSLGDADLRRGRFDSAARHHLRSLTLFHQTGDPVGQAKALNGLGSALLSVGRVADAHTRHTQALALARKLDDSYEQARALGGLGHAEDALGDPEEARRQWQQALTLYTRLGTPEADEIRSLLAKMTDLPAKSRS